MTRAYFTDTVRSIKRSMTRFISMVLIVFLGSSVFCGFKATYPDMIESADKYYKENNLYDIRLQSYIGIYDEDLERVRQIEGVKNVAGARFVDGYVRMLNDDVKPEYEGLVDIDGSELTIRAYGYDPDDAKSFTENGKNDAQYINRLKLIEGEYADEVGECVVTNSGLTTPDGFQIGKTLKIVGDGESIDYSLKAQEYVIVGIVQTPYFVSFERGTTTAGSGKLGDYIYIPNETFTDNVKYYSEAYVTLNDSDKYEAYSEEYNNYVKSYIDKIREASLPIVAERAAQLSIEYTQQVIDGEQKLALAEQDIQTQLAAAKADMENYAKLAETGAQEIEKAKAEMESQFGIAQEEYNSSSAQYNAGVAKWNSMSQLVAKQEVAWENADKTYTQKKEQADAAEIQLASADSQIKLARAQITTAQTAINSLESTLTTLKSTQDVAVSDLDLLAMADRLEETNPELAQVFRSAAKLTAQGTAAEAIALTEKSIADYKVQLAANESELAAAQAEYDTNRTKLDTAQKQLAAAKISLETNRTKLDEAKKQLEATKQELASGELELKFGSMELSTKYLTAQAELALKTAQLAQIQDLLANSETIIAQKEADAYAELEFERTRVTKGRNLIDNLDTANWSVYDRGEAPGYSGYGDAAYNMKLISTIFPVLFFVVSVLVCLTVMTRMIEEERTQLGTLKALGYEDKTIAMKYITYALLAGVIGFILGMLIGSFGLPRALMGAWGIMYEIPDRVVRYYPVYIILSFVFSVATTMFATLWACRKELLTNTATLMRPKAPKGGKRVWLEKIDFVWSRLSFTSKVTVRNLFRNKRRFITTIVGIVGCTALLVIGIGFYFSTGSIINGQYANADCIAGYDLQIVLKDAQESSAGSEVVQSIVKQPDISSAMLTYLKVCRGSSENWDSDLEVNVFVPEDKTLMSQFLRLRDDRRGTALELPDEGAIITGQFAKDAGVKVGDYVTVSWIEGAKTVTYNVLVAAIAENYTFHYVYMSPTYFSQLTGARPQFNYLVASLKEDVTQNARIQLETTINDMPEVNGTVYTTVIVDTFSNIIKSLNIVIGIVICAAAVLAFVVLNTLNNINIKERVKELATLKVLGFYDKEVSAYIYRENIILTLIGIIFGLILGSVLEKAVVSMLAIEVVTFTSKPFPLMFVISAAITAVFAVFVNLLMHRSLKKISMVESLKSVE
ncbi:MAG: FtsX-like permease family protein [Clostridiales bacterium]|nr:FtsX-like permease family protein [Clostridiales bacterium]